MISNLISLWLETIYDLNPFEFIETYYGLEYGQSWQMFKLCVLEKNVYSAIVG